MTPAGADGGVRPSRLQVAGLLVLLSGLLAAAVVGLHIAERGALSATGPQEGYYWTVAQYQIAFGRMREELRAAAEGGRVDPDRLHLRLQILLSRTHILTAPSELTGYYASINGFPQAAARLTDFSRQVLSQVPDVTADKVRAAALLAAFDEHEHTVLTLANDIRLEEIHARERYLAGVVARRTLVMAALFMVWLLMVGWVIQLYVSSRLRRLAQQREEALMAERNAVRSKNVFLGMVSHELRTPLQSMLSAIELLELQGRGAALGPALQGIRRSAATLERQLRDLLALAQAEAGRLEVRPEPFDVVELLENVVEDFRFAAEKKNLHIGLQVVGSASPCFVVADPLRVGQVVANLISNAIKYTVEGSVQVRLLPYRADTGRLVIEVEDTGAGIPAAVLPRLFHAFDRLEADPRPDSGGIGLAVVRAVVTQLGGRIEVNSVDGRGTCFRVEIAAAPAGDAVPRAPSDGMPLGRLLVVDDQPDVLSGLAEVARQLGWVCDTADGAVAGLNHAAATAYDLVLIDLNMPWRGGHELAADIRRLPGPNQRSRLFAMSASSAGELAGVFDGLEAKPIAVRTLRKLFAASSPAPATVPPK
jgi:signal transduction histidine kinase/CheY-like chemotaxis protein